MPCRSNHPTAFSRISRSFACTRSPGTTSTASTSASRSAATWVSIFIASNASSVLPALTRWPTLTATLTIAPWLRKLNYSVDSFVPVAKIASSYGLITAQKNAPFSNYKEFVAAAKANPGKYSFATNGVGSVVHLTAVLLHKQAGIDVLHVPYKGASESMNDLIGGRVTLMYDPATAPRVKEGTLKGLATTSSIRNPELPNLPTLKEQGFAIPYSGSWFGIFAPKGTPGEIVNKMAGFVKQALESPGVREQLQHSALYPDFEGPADFGKQVRADAEILREVIQKEGIKLE